MTRFFLLLVAACSGTAAPPAGPATPPSAPPVSRPAPAPVPPVAERRPHEIASPHGTRVDPYYWLRDDTRKDPAVLAYLNAENAYTAAVMAPLRSLEDTLFAEMRARVAEDDSTVPTFEDGYWSYSRFEAGKQYPIYVRRKGTLSAPEEVVLDGNQLATGHAYFRVGTLATSRDGRYVAWADDTVGRGQYTLHVKDLTTGAVLPDTATNIAPDLAWANDHATLFYVGKDPTTLREDRVLRKRLGGPEALAYQERDTTYYVYLKPTKSRRYVAIELSATTSSEVRLLDADKPATAPRVFVPRRKDHLYELDHLDDRFVMMTSSNAKNFRVVSIAPGREGNPAAWQELIPHRPDTLVEGIGVYRGFLAASIRSGGLRKVEIRRPGKPPLVLDAPDPAYAMTLVDVPDADARRVRFAYDSPTQPSSVYEADPDGANRTLLKQQRAPTYDPSKYASEYVHATAQDGAKIPISVVYRKDTPRDGTAPLLVYGYGAYGISMEPRFDLKRVSLLDRGWVFAIAHVRGGEELGRAWYEAGRQLQKRNTFTDFIAATEHLVAQRYGARDRVHAMGGSAGGLLMGAIANLRPDLYRSIQAFVPFVDAVTTMLDESIPLTTNEFDEWGNPKEKPAYDYMLSYSPYDNITAQRYPAMYVKTGLWDSQVQYFEPAKWVAKLRATKTDSNPLVLDIDMSAGHGGKSGRFDALRDAARGYAFMIGADQRR